MRDRPRLVERKFDTDWGELRVRYQGITVGEKVAILEALEDDTPALASWAGILDGLTVACESLVLAGEKIEPADVPDGVEVEVVLAHPSFRRGQSESE